MTPKVSYDSPFDRRCVWSVQNSPGLSELFRASSLNLALLEPRSIFLLTMAVASPPIYIRFTLLPGPAPEFIPILIVQIGTRHLAA